MIGRLHAIELTNLDFSHPRKFASSHFLALATKLMNSHHSMSTSVNKQGPILKKSRSGCRDCRRRKVKVSRSSYAIVWVHSYPPSAMKRSLSVRIVGDGIQISSAVTGALTYLATHAGHSQEQLYMHSLPPLNCNQAQ